MKDDDVQISATKSLLERSFVEGKTTQCAHRNTWEIDSGKRRKCKKCNLKFTPNKEQSRLKEAVLLQILYDFAYNISATDSAKFEGINIKTVQRFWKLIRIEMNKDSEKRLEKLGTGIAPLKELEGYKVNCGNKPAFGLIKDKNTILVVFPEQISKEAENSIHAYVFIKTGNSDTDGILKNNSFKFYLEYSKDFSEYDKRRFYNFVKFSKTVLSQYHGACFKAYPLYMREAEFKFNQSFTSVETRKVRVVDKSIARASDVRTDTYIESKFKRFGYKTGTGAKLKKLMRRAIKK